MAKQRKTHKVKWEEAVIKKTAEEFKKYSSSASFYTGDMINHTKFGKGYVESSFGNKIEVRFEDKMRLLIHKVVF